MSRIVWDAQHGWHNGPTVDVHNIGGRIVITPNTRETSTLWVCVDCYLTHHGVREDDGETPDCEPLSLVHGEEISDGIMLAEHGDWCTESDRESGACTCEHDDFSSRRCDGCGSALGGSRDALTLWHNAITD